MKRFLSIFSTLVIILFCLSLFGWVVKHITLGDRKFGFITKPIKAMVDFPDMFKKSVKEVKTLPGTFVKTPESFGEINELTDDVKALITYSNEKKNRSIELLNLRTNESLHKWEVKNTHQAHDRIMDPLLFADNSVAYSFNGVTGISKIDKDGELLWKQDSVPHHHSLNFDADSNIWACSYTKEGNNFIIYKGFYKIDGRKFGFIDNSISKLDGETGRVLFHKSMAEILLENDLEYLLIQSANTEDPIHLNDIQPAFESTDFYEKGDLFLSIRNLSCILHYRPSTNKVVELIQGPFSTQHDVDFYNDSTIVFFNNNGHTLWQYSPSQWKHADAQVDLGNHFSRITFYDLKNKTFYHKYDSLFAANQLFTHTEGGQEFLPDGSVFVEEQNHGYTYIFKGDKTIYRHVFPSHHQGYHHLTNWIRIIK